MTTSLGSPVLLLPLLQVWNGSWQCSYYLEPHLHNHHKEHSDTVASVESITSILNKDGFVLSQRILTNAFMLAAAILVVSRIVLPYLAVASNTCMVSKTPLPLIYSNEALHLPASPYLTNMRAEGILVLATNSRLLIKNCYARNRRRALKDFAEASHGGAPNLKHETLKPCPVPAATFGAAVSSGQSHSKKGFGA